MRRYLAADIVPCRTSTKPFGTHYARGTTVRILNQRVHSEFKSGIAVLVYITNSIAIFEVCASLLTDVQQF